MRWHALSIRRSSSVERGGARPGHCSLEHPSRSIPTPQFCEAAGGAWDGNHLGNRGSGGPSSQAPHLEPSSHHASVNPDAQGLEPSAAPEPFGVTGQRSLAQ
ncbi:unnamed protein product [Rangifer tarandus platyrhynchus]|uniref:Uncharacterized protein n=2 Tax=Rangifer tarandus platyrhynchus TaxID=3082113 RepID=A0ABN8XXG9_RANTA|nr:unnamed protein product [Rangifer tarandus platyrhynchus]CAI9713575.1 unnamed protein product [Rangifer tarandus platyrhynchus]